MSHTEKAHNNGWVQMKQLQCYETMKFRESQGVCQKKAIVRPSWSSWLCLQYAHFADHYKVRPLGKHAVQVSCLHLLNSHMTVRFGVSHHSGLWIAGYLVTSRQIQAQLPHLGEGVWLNPGQPLRSDWPLGKGPGPGVFHVHPCTFLFHTRKGSEGQSWDNFLFIPDLVLHVG